MNSKRFIVALTGASGIKYGIAVINALVELEIETHVIISEWAINVMETEAKMSTNQLKELPIKIYNNKEMDSIISSSSSLFDGMVVIPSTVKTVSNIASANTGDLISRAADIMIKMRKPLVIGLRETPLSTPCLENLFKLSTYGHTIILPLSPGFYHEPKTIDDLINFITGKVLDCLNIPNKKYKRWMEDK